MGKKFLSGLHLRKRKMEDGRLDERKGVQHHGMPLNVPTIVIFIFEILPRLFFRNRKFIDI